MTTQPRRLIFSLSKGQVLPKGDKGPKDKTQKHTQHNTMRTYEATAYTFNELGDKAKQSAKDSFFANSGYSWADDAFASLKAFAKAFDARIVDYSIDYWHTSPSYAEFDAPEMERPEIEARIKMLGNLDPVTFRGLGECKLTGYCADEDALDGLRKAFYSGESDLNELLQEGFESWLKAAQADCEHQASDEAFAELCEANGYEFDEDGTML